MKNILVKTVLATSLVASSMFAEGTFVGSETGYYNSQISNDLLSYNNGQIDLGLKTGYNWDSYRVYVGYSYGISFDKPNKLSFNLGGPPLFFSLNHKRKEHRLVIGGDWTPNITENLKFSIGAYTGLAILDVNYKLRKEDNYGLYLPPHIATIIENAGTKDKTYMGWILGAKIGGIYGMSSNSEIEFGMKVEKTDYKNDTFNPLEGLKNVTSKPLFLNDIDNSGTRYGLYLGYNYKF